MAHILQPQIDCSSARKFLDALSPLGKHFDQSKPNEPWLFRGQGKDKPLVPSAFRNCYEKLAALTNRDIQNYEQCLQAERDILIQFFNIADKRGLVLPDDSQKLRSTLETLKSQRGNNSANLRDDGWQMHNVALSLMALAQHYGIPTRLLDWTRQPFIAAFFAAEDALRCSLENPALARMVVWAFYFPALGKHDVIARTDDPIRVVTAPTATNPNLKAQQGAFTLLHPYDTKEAEGNYRPMEQVLEDTAKDADPARSDSDKLIVGCRLRKFTLPSSKASELLYLLAKIDITSSAIYPGYHSIVEDMRMQRRWPQLC